MQMSNDGLIDPGSLLEFVKKNGFSGKRLTRSLSREEVTSLIAELTSNSFNANVRIRTDFSCYNIVAVFGTVEDEVNRAIDAYAHRGKKNAWWKFW